MIGIAMEKWPNDALRRVVDAPLEAWKTGGSDGDWVSGDSRPKPFAGCLWHHAGGEEEDWIDAVRRIAHVNDEIEDLSWRRFDRLCERFGLPRTVRAIKLRALAILLKRHPLDNRLAALRAETAGTP